MANVTYFPATVPSIHVVVSGMLSYHYIRLRRICVICWELIRLQTKSHRIKQLQGYEEEGGCYKQGHDTILKGHCFVPCTLVER